MHPERPPLRLSDVGAEAALIAGGGRAVLLQLANPAIGHAIASHSSFRTQPLRRLRNTLTFVYAIVYGTPGQVAAVQQMVNGTHSTVRSGAGESPNYDATDAALQLWVVATLYDTAITLRERLIAPLTEQDRDAIYADYEMIGTALQVPAGMWPPDRAAFHRYWQAESAKLSVDDTVREVSRALLHPRSGPLWLRAGMPLARLVTAGLLSPELRSQFGMRWSRGRERRFGAAMAGIAAVNRVLPRGVREWPKGALLRKLGQPAIPSNGT